VGGCIFSFVIVPPQPNQLLIIERTLKTDLNTISIVYEMLYSHRCRWNMYLSLSWTIVKALLHVEYFLNNHSLCHISAARRKAMDIVYCLRLQSISRTPYCI